MARDSWLTKGEGDALDDALHALQKTVDERVAAGYALAKGGWVRKEANPSPSDAPAPPEVGFDFEDAVRREQERLGKKWHGTTSSLRRAAVASVKSRRTGGSLNGAALYAAGPGGELGPRIDGAVLRPHKKRPRIL